MKKKKQKLSPGEEEVMAVLWEQPGIGLGSLLGTLNQNRQKEMKRTTLQVVLKRIVNKGWLKVKEGQRGNLYFPVVDSDSSRRGILNDLKDRLFGGSSLDLVRCMFNENISAEELDQLEAWVREQKK